MDKTEIKEMLDKLSDAKLDYFISFLRYLQETADSEQPQEVYRQA